MSFKSLNIIDQVSDTTSDLMSGIVTGVIDATSSVSQSAEALVSSVSSGVGDAVHNMSAGMKRLVTSPPKEDDFLSETGILSPDTILPTPEDYCGSESSFMSEINYFSNLLPNDSPVEQTPSFDLGISENYFSEPEIFDLGRESSVEELEDAIYKAKDQILNCEESTQKRRYLVQKLIHLRLALEKAKEAKIVANEGIQVKQGHKLTPVSPRLKSPSTKQFCDKCCQIIWNVLHVAYYCSLCDYKCHGKCVKSNHPKCPSLKFEENPNYITTQICPEVGLDVQNFRCGQCRNLINGRNVWAEPRLCDYTGQYFCPACHWNAFMVSPARIIHNWEFELQPVSQQAKRFLNYVLNKPLLALEELNPNLFMFVKELHIVRKLRKDLIMMKNYLRTCKGAQESRLLRRLEVRQHFVDSSHYYSLKDLTDLNEGMLIPFLKEVNEEFASHIKKNCEVCRGKGFICELCDSEDVIFPFDDHIDVCKICQASFHEKCFSSINVCPRCIRQSSRRLQSQQEEGKTII